MSKKRNWFKEIWSKMLESKPTDVTGDSISQQYWAEFLRNTVYGWFRFSGFPDFWDLSYFNEILFKNGYICITDTPLGVLPLSCGYSGYNVFEHPTQCLIDNPIFKETLTRTIDEDCALVHIRPGYAGIENCIRRYSVMLAMCDASICGNLINTRVARIYRANSSTEAKNYKAMYDEIEEGNPAVFVGDGLTSTGEWFDDRVKEHYIASDVHQLKVAILNDFYTEWGIPNSNTEKRERLVEAEVGAKDYQVRASVQNILDNIRDGFNVANRLFNLSLAVDLLETEVGDVDTLEPNAVDSVSSGYV